MATTADQQSIQYCTTMQAFFAFDELMDNLETRIRMWETERRKYMHDPNPATMTALTFAHEDWIAASKAVREAYAELLPTDEMQHHEYSDFCARAGIKELSR